MYCCLCLDVEEAILQEGVRSDQVYLESQGKSTEF